MTGSRPSRSRERRKVLQGLGHWVDSTVEKGDPFWLAGQVAVVARETSWAQAIALGITLPALLVPDGRLRSCRWRLVVADTVVGVVLLVVGRDLAPGPLTGGRVP